MNAGGLEAPPVFSAAGTVYATSHEANDCNGATGVSVVITDANRATYTLPVNAAGNFSTSAALAFPIQAKVVAASGAERAMVAAQATGDCNSCHTPDGANGAPGRIALP
jgi:mono/diheme cytochrome c family protein